MCFEKMAARIKHVKNDCLRKTTKPASALRWRLLRVSAEEALKQCGADALRRTTIRKYLRREQKRIQLAKLAEKLAEVKENEEAMLAERQAAACTHRSQPGAMAPENTTQYLMSNVYEDMKADNVESVPVLQYSHLYDECLSPRSVYSALDSGYESCLAFQQHDFEEVCDLSW